MPSSGFLTKNDLESPIDYPQNRALGLWCSQEPSVGVGVIFKFRVSKSHLPNKVLENFWKFISQERHIEIAIRNRFRNKVWFLRLSQLRIFAKKLRKLFSMFFNRIRTIKDVCEKPKNKPSSNYLCLKFWIPTAWGLKFW